MAEPEELEPDEKAAFAGEEGGGVEASPNKDLVAAFGVAVLAVVAIVFAARLPNPGTFYSAPSLLPILTGACLIVMAIALGTGAIRDGARINLDFGPAWRAWFDDVENRRTLLLISIIVCYVAAAGAISFDLRFPTRVFVFRLSSYEVISFPFLAAILRIFWRASLARCGVVSLIIVVALASIFRHGFKILLPGAG
jgi:hypothetical protein